MKRQPSQPISELLDELGRAKPGARISAAPESAARADGAFFALMEIEGTPKLCITGKHGSASGFEIEESIGSGTRVIHLCPLNHENARMIRSTLPFTRPSRVGRFERTFGVGDRLGVAGPGHVAVFREFDATPVLAQQSVRELTLTSRGYEDVLDASTWSVFREGYREPWGADGDHLKTEEWVRRALATGFTMITADVSDFIQGEHAMRSSGEVAASYDLLDGIYRKEIEERYLSRSFALGGESVFFSETELRRTALIYGNAIAHAARLYRAGEEAQGREGFDFELSVDETATPTTPQAHVFIVMEAKRKGITISSLAPRFAGEFQKGIDYIGTIGEFEASFATHAAIARSFGHRISIHSGSDKFSIFPSIGRLSAGRFHIKTAGTSWLEALRVIGEADPGLFRELYIRARETYGEALAFYHVTPDLSGLPPSEHAGSLDARSLLDDPNARQLMHVTYGGILAVPRLREGIFRTLGHNDTEYREALRSHIGKHLSALGVRRGRS